MNWREEIVTVIINLLCSVIGFSFVLSIYQLCIRLKHRREEDMNMINFTAEDDQAGDVEKPYENDDPAAASTPQLQSFENTFTTPETANSNWLPDSQVNIINSAVTNGTYEADIPPLPPSYSMTDEERERMRNARLFRLEWPIILPHPRLLYNKN